MLSFVNINLGTNAVFNLIQGALNDYRVQVTCAVVNHTENGVSYPVFNVDSFAQRGSFGNPDYASRRVQKTLTNAP